jgi:hypothetical protein
MADQQKKRVAKKKSQDTHQGCSFSFKYLFFIHFSTKKIVFSSTNTVLEVVGWHGILFSKKWVLRKEIPLGGNGCREKRRKNKGRNSSDTLFLEY